jgi:ribonuclease T1
VARTRGLIVLCLGLWLGLFSSGGSAFWWDFGPSPAARAEVTISQLPPEARHTLALIRRGGPFPYAKDGSVFHNRERRLPLRPRGYYREYTVPTPGSRDRGARRIISGSGGDYWYTGDHYRRFQRIRE